MNGSFREMTAKLKGDSQQTAGYRHAHVLDLATMRFCEEIQ